MDLRSELDPISRRRINEQNQSKMEEEVRIQVDRVAEIPLTLRGKHRQVCWM